MADVDNARIGDQLYCTGDPTTFGSVRAVSRPTGIVVGWIENYGETEIQGEWIARVHNGKVELDPQRLPDELKTAIAHAHDREVM